MFGTTRFARRNDRVITRWLIGLAIAFGVGFVSGTVSGVLEAAPAGADPSPFNTLSCSCQESAPPGSPARRDEITRGLRQGLSD
jgi:hypothetical protein